MTRTALIRTLILLSAMPLLSTWATFSRAGNQEPVTLVVAKPAEPYPPFHYMDEAGNPMGLQVDTLRLVAAGMGLKLDFKCIPWKRSLLFMRTGEVDTMLSLYRTPEREAYMIFPEEPFAMDQSVFFTRKDTPVPWNGDLHKIENLTIMMVEDNSYGKTFDTADYLTKWVATDEEEMLRMVHGGRYPLGVAGRGLVIDMARQMGFLSEIEILEPPVTTEGVYMAFSRAAGHEQLAQDFSAALKAFKQTHLYRILLRKHGLR